LPLVRKPGYFLTLRVDPTNLISESNEKNNSNRGLVGVDAEPVAIAQRLPSKLVAAGLSVAPGPLDWGGSMTVTATVRNEGPGEASPANARIVLAPYGEDPFGPRGYTIGAVPLPEVAPGQTASATQTIRIPAIPPLALADVGRFAVVMVSDAEGMAADPVQKPFSYEGPGLDWTSIQLSARPGAPAAAPLPDLAVGSLTTPTVIAWDQNVAVRATLVNHGAAAAGAFTVRFSLVQSDDPNAPALSLGEFRVNGLASGATQELVQTLKLPARVPAGLDPNATQARIVARIDPGRMLDEPRIDNNRLASPSVQLRLVAQDGTVAPVVTTTPNAPTAPTSRPGTGSGSGETPQTPQQPVQVRLTRQQRLEMRRQRAREARRLAELQRQQRQLERRLLRVHEAQANRPNLRVVTGPQGPAARPRNVHILPFPGPSTNPSKPA
jgi:hypothetical protein